jgi:hypothetical protein
MKVIHYKGTDPVEKLNRIGRQIETKKKLEGLNVSKVTKEQALEAWNEVKLNYEKNE